MHFLSSALALSFAALASAQFITAPANGTALVPGAPFVFTYEAQAGDCANGVFGGYQSYNYAVYLLTADPAKTALAPGHGGPLSTGRFLGRFPRVPFTRNLTAPNFDAVASGQGNEPPVAASNRPVWLAVIEEIEAACDDTLGEHLYFSYNKLVYNATKH